MMQLKMNQNAQCLQWLSTAPYWVLEVSNALYCFLNCSCALDLSNGVVLFPECGVMLSKSFVYFWRLYDVAGVTVEPNLSVAVFAVQVHPRGFLDVVI